MKKWVAAIAVLSAMAFWGVDARASVVYVDGTTQVIDGISRFNTSGNLMEGMEVTVTYSDSSTETAFWEVIDYSSGGASGSGNNWSLLVTNDTYKISGSWNLWVDPTTPIESIYLAGKAGNTFFDVYDGMGDTNDTPYSKWGWAFDTMYTGYDDSIVTATYYNLVAVDGHSAVGDLYEDLEVSFNSGSFSGDYIFNADTDNTNAVPVPATALLLASGLIGILGLTGRRSR